MRERAKLLRELIATVIYADTLGLDPAQAICDNAVLKKAMASDTSLAELAGADLPIALESARVLSKAYGAPAHPGLGRSYPQLLSRNF